MQKPLLLVVGDRVSVIMPNAEIEVGVLKAGDQVELFHDGHALPCQRAQGER